MVGLPPAEGRRPSANKPDPQGADGRHITIAFAPCPPRVTAAVYGPFRVRCQLDLRLAKPSHVCGDDEIGHHRRIAPVTKRKAGQAKVIVQPVTDAEASPPTVFRARYGRGVDWHLVRRRGNERRPPGQVLTHQSNDALFRANPTRQHSPYRISYSYIDLAQGWV